MTVPLNMGADFVARSDLGNELNYVPVDRATLQSTRFENIFAVGDASDIPASKAGSVAHFSVEIFVDNFLELVRGMPMTRSFDGHANCFVESGDGKALLIDFNYDTQPLSGHYPLPVLGPMSLLKETRVNHLGKLAFRWVYWNLLLPGRPLPLPAAMSMAGKMRPARTQPDPISRGSEHDACHDHRRPPGARQRGGFPHRPRRSGTRPWARRWPPGSASSSARSTGRPSASSGRTSPSTARPRPCAG